MWRLRLLFPGSIEILSALDAETQECHGCNLRNLDLADQVTTLDGSAER